MKKLILVLVLVVVGAVAAAPYITGGVLQERFEKEQTLPGLPKDMLWHVDHFKRGYLHSTATSTLTLSNIGGKAYVLHFKHQIDQLPGIDGHYAVVHTEWVPQDGDVKSALTKLFGNQAVFSMATRMFLTGGTKSTGEVPAINQSGVDFSGANLMVATHADRHFSYEVDASKLMLEPSEWPNAKKSDQGQFLMHGLSMKAHGQIAEDGIIWDSEGKFDVERMQVIGAPKGDVNLDGVAVRFNSKREGDDASMEVAYGVKHVQAPGAKVDDAEMVIRLSKVSVEALRSLQKQMESVQKRSSGNAKEDQQRILGVLMMQLPALVDHGMKVDFDPIKAKVKQGPVLMHLSFDLPPNAMSGALGAGGGQAVMAIVQKLTVKGDITLPKALLAAQANKPGQPPLEQRLAPLEQKGYITDKDGTIHSTLHFENGHLTINGVPADDLLAAMMARRQHR